MDYHALLLFTLTEAALSLSPGPAVFLVVATGLGRGWRASLIASAGILTGNACYFLISAFGIGGLLQKSPLIFLGLKYLGAAYLLYLAWSALTGRPSAISITKQTDKPEPTWRQFKHALFLQLLNPKTLLMFVAILPQFIKPQLAIAPQMLVLAACSIIPEFFILALYGMLASKAARFAAHPEFALYIERCAGVLILLAAGMVILN